MSNINTIRLSGTTYQIEDSNAPKTVELTQAQYDALVDKDPNTFYVITDAEAGDLTNYYTKTETDNAITAATSTKQDTLVSSQNIKTINNTSILGSGNIDIQGGGGKAVTGGTNISVTTGETADTINCTLPISADTNANVIVLKDNTIEGTSYKSNNVLVGYNNTLSLNGTSYGNFYNLLFGNSNTIQKNNSYSSSYNIVFGVTNQLSGSTENTFISGISNKGFKSHQKIFGYGNEAKNVYECVLGIYNNSVSASTTFGDSGNTLFSVGNGILNEGRHNAFELKQNGDIYIVDTNDTSTSNYYEKPMIKLQDHLGGGGSSYTAGDGIDITNNVISVTGKVDTSSYNTYTAATDTALASKADTSAVTAIQDSLSGYVTTDTEQIISGRKIFTYSASSSKAIEFKQTDDSAKVGFRVRTSAETNNELASFEFRPNTFTVGGVQHPLLYFGHYRSTNTAAAGVPQTYIGFRQYDQPHNAAYHYLLPLPERAKTPFNLTTSFKDYYAPMGFKNGSTMITADDTGVVDLSSEFGGLKLVKLTQAEYDALSTKDSNTLYVIIN